MLHTVFVIIFVYKHYQSVHFLSTSILAINLSRTRPEIGHNTPNPDISSDIASFNFYTEQLSIEIQFFLRQFT